MAAFGAERFVGEAIESAPPADELWPMLRAAAADPWNDAARDGLGAALAHA